MKYCKKCGSQLTDNAVFCPKCGTRIENSTPSKDSHLPIWAKVSLGIVFAFTCLCSIALLTDGHWIGGIITICALGAIIAIFMGVIDKKYALPIALASLFFAFFFTAEAGEENKDTSSAREEQVEEQTGEPTVEISEEKEQKKEAVHDFFENGYKYTTSYRVTRKQGFGISCNYKYIVKIYNDGTKEISCAHESDDGSPVTQGTQSCTINKKSESYRDVNATWYEINFDSGPLYVDERGNVIMLYENGNDKNIYEAIATKDCIYGKFTKNKLTNEVYRCRTCGEEFDPSREFIYSEDYCYKDYPQVCKYCGKSFTVREEGSGACKQVCAACFHKKQSVKIYEEVTGRKIN